MPPAKESQRILSIVFVTPCLYELENLSDVINPVMKEMTLDGSTDIRAGRTMAAGTRKVKERFETRSKRMTIPISALISPLLDLPKIKQAIDAITVRKIMTFAGDSCFIPVLSSMMGKVATAI